MPRPKADPTKPNRPGERLLMAIARHHALSREQATIAAGFAEGSSQSYVDEHLARITTVRDPNNREVIVSERFLEKVIPTERTMPSLYFLGRKGTAFLRDAGVSIDERVHHKLPTGFNLSHRYWTTWVLVRLEQSGCQILEARNEWQLSRTAAKLALPNGKKVGYAPDLWTKVRYGDREYSIAWEIDRGSEHQDPWRHKVQEMVAFTSKDANGEYPFRDLFATENLRYAITVVPGIVNSKPPEDRAREMKHWTEFELAKLKKAGWANLMFIRPMDPSVSVPQELFFDPCWVKPFETAYQPLMGGIA